MTVTALVLARDPAFDLRIEGVEVLAIAGRVFASSADHQAAWNDAIRAVRTEHFFFIDDDDELPVDHAEVIAECLAAGTDLVYTDEALRFADGAESLTRGHPYSQALHLANPMLVHHLALCRTQAALEALAVLPTGHYWPEMLLYWQMAKRSVAYVPRTGYIWNVREQGFHTEPFAGLGQMRSQLWCKEHP